MLKRTLLALLLLLPALSTGCKPQSDNVNPANGNKQAANISLIANGNTNGGGTDPITPLIPFNREDKSVAVIVYQDDAGAIKILVVPDPIKLSKAKGQRLRFHVFNNTEVDFSKVEFSFADNPFDGAFTINDIKAGDDKGDTAKKIRSGAALKKYKYTIKVYNADPAAPPIPPLDPEVEIAT